MFPCNTNMGVRWPAPAVTYSLGHCFRMDVRFYDRIKSSPPDCESRIRYAGLGVAQDLGKCGEAVLALSVPHHLTTIFYAEKIYRNVMHARVCLCVCVKAGFVVCQMENEKIVCSYFNCILIIGNISLLSSSTWLAHATGKQLK